MESGLRSLSWDQISRLVRPAGRKLDENAVDFWKDLNDENGRQFREMAPSAHRTITR